MRSSGQKCTHADHRIDGGKRRTRPKRMKSVQSPLPAGRPPNHSPACESGRHRNAHWQSYLSRDRHHGVSEEQRQVGSGAANRQPRIAADKTTNRRGQPSFMTAALTKSRSMKSSGSRSKKSRVQDSGSLRNVDPGPSWTLRIFPRVSQNCVF